VDEVRYRENFLRLLEKYQRLIFIAVVTAFIGLTLISIILASNSIKMTIFSRRNVIATMKLVGATNNFVRAPFLIEGTLEGLIGALLASGVIGLISYFFNNYLIFSERIVFFEKNGTRSGTGRRNGWRRAARGKSTGLRAQGLAVSSNAAHRL